MVKRSLNPSPIYIEPFGTDEQTEDQLMEVIEQVKASPEFLSLSKAGDNGAGVCKSLSTSSSLVDDDVMS